MKIELTVNKHIPTEITFPILAKSEIGRHVVLFISSTHGIVITKGDSSLSVGRYEKDFYPVEEASKWEILPTGTQVTFTQE